MQETQEMWVQSLDQDDPLENEMGTHSSILAWKNPWTGETGGLQSMGLQKNQMWLATKQQWQSRYVVTGLDTPDSSDKMPASMIKELQGL